MKKLMLVLVSLLLVTTGCAGNQREETAKETPKGQADKPKTSKIQVTGNEYSFDVASTVEGGFVEVDFKNDGKLVHEAAFIKNEPETPQDQFIKDLKIAEDEEGAIAPSIKPYVFPKEVKPGKSGATKFSLPAGNYFLVCTLSDADSQEAAEGEEEGEEPKLPSHYEQGMIKKVTVTGPSTVTLPEAEAVIGATEYAFEVTGLKAGKNEVLFQNEGVDQIHMAAILEFPEGIDESKAEETIKNFGNEGPPPPGTPEPKDVAFGGLFEPGGGSLFSVNLKKDRVYAIVCFVQDRSGPPPHVAKGMFEITKVA